MLSDEQMSEKLQFSLLNDEQMSNWVGVKHLPVVFFSSYLFRRVMTSADCTILKGFAGDLGLKGHFVIGGMRVLYFC